MDVVYSSRPLWAVLVSMIAAFLILATGEKNRNIRESWTIIAAFVKFFIVASMIPLILQGKVIEYTIVTFYPGLLLQFRIDAFGMLFGLIASSLWIATSFYSIGYVRGLNEHAQTRYFFAFAMCLSSTIGIAFSANLLTFLVFYEILTIATYPLVIHKESKEGIMGGRKYLAYTLTAGCVLLFAIAMIYHMTGTLDFKAGGFIAGSGSSAVLIMLFAMLIFGFGVKAGIMPMHEWLPTAMVAPTPVSALLHAVAVVKAGVFGCLRVILYVFGPGLLHDLGIWLIMAYVASFTIIVAGFLALGQDHLKRRLAFSTINNLAMIILGAALLTKSSMTGGIIHMANHAFMKITLFFCAGALHVKMHKDYVSQLDGIGRQMPLTMGAFAIAAIGLSGIPPMSGFISKWFLCLGALEANQIIFLFVFMTSAMLDVAFLFPIIYNSFFKKPLDDVAPHFDEAPMLMVIPLSITALLSLVFGIAPDAFVHFFSITTMAVQNIMGVG